MVTPCSYEKRTPLISKEGKATAYTAPVSLLEVLDRILDKGIVLDAYVTVAIVGIEILAVRIRVVIASVDTYLKYASAMGITAAAPAAVTA